MDSKIILKHFRQVFILVFNIFMIFIILLFKLLKIPYFSLCNCCCGSVAMSLVFVELPEWRLLGGQVVSGSPIQQSAVTSPPNTHTPTSAHSHPQKSGETA